MKKNRTIHKIAQVSLVLFISASPMVNATDLAENTTEGHGHSGLRDHGYYKAALQKLEESTRRIHAEVDRILEEFRKNMKEYYLWVRGTSGMETTLDHSTGSNLDSFHEAHTPTGDLRSGEGKEGATVIIGKKLVEETGVTGKPSSQGTEERREPTEELNTHSLKAKEEEKPEEPLITGSTVVKEEKKDDDKNLPSPTSSKKDEKNAEGGAVKKENTKIDGPKKVLTAKDLEGNSELKKEFNWNNSGIREAADYYCKLSGITEVRESNIGSIINNIGLVFLFQKSGATNAPEQEDIATLRACIYSLSDDMHTALSIENLLDKNILVNYAIAKYIIEKKQKVEKIDSQEFGILKISEFKDENPAWWPGKKIVPQSSPFASPKKASKIINSNIAQPSIPERGYGDLEEYKKGIKIVFPESLLEKKVTMVIVFDGVKEMNGKTLVKGPHKYEFKQ